MGVTTMATKMSEFEWEARAAALAEALRSVQAENATLRAKLARPDIDLNVKLTKALDANERLRTERDALRELLSKQAQWIGARHRENDKLGAEMAALSRAIGGARGRPRDIINAAVKYIEDACLDAETQRRLAAYKAWHDVYRREHITSARVINALAERLGLATRREVEHVMLPDGTSIGMHERVLVDGDPPTKMPIDALDAPSPQHNAIGDSYALESARTWHDVYKYRYLSALDTIESLAKELGIGVRRDYKNVDGEFACGSVCVLHLDRSPQSRETALGAYDGPVHQLTSGRISGETYITPREDADEMKPLSTEAQRLFDLLAERTIPNGTAEDVLRAALGCIEQLYVRRDVDHGSQDWAKTFDATIERMAHALRIRGTQTEVLTAAAYRLENGNRSYGEEAERLFGKLAEMVGCHEGSPRCNVLQAAIKQINATGGSATEITRLTQERNDALAKAAHALRCMNRAQKAMAIASDDIVARGITLSVDASNRIMEILAEISRDFATSDNLAPTDKMALIHVYAHNLGVPEPGSLVLFMLPPNTTQAQAEEIKRELKRTRSLERCTVLFLRDVDIDDRSFLLHSIPAAAIRSLIDALGDNLAMAEAHGAATVRLPRAEPPPALPHLDGMIDVDALRESRAEPHIGDWIQPMGDADADVVCGDADEG